MTALITIVRFTFFASTGRISARCLGAAKECTVKQLIVLKKIHSVRAEKFNIMHSRVPCGFRCKRYSLRPLVERVHFFYCLCHCDRDLAGTAADLKDGVGAAQSQFEQGDCHDLVLGRAAGKFCPVHLHKFGCVKV